MTLQNVQNNIMKTASSKINNEDVALYSANVSDNGTFNININVVNIDKYVENLDGINSDMQDFIKNISLTAQHTTEAPADGQ